MTDLQEDAVRQSSSQSEADRYLRLAETLDAAGLGPADYLYSPLRKRLRKPGKPAKSLLSLILDTAKALVNDPPIITGDIRKAPILFAASYINSVGLLKRVASNFPKEDYAFCSTLESSRQPSLADRLRIISALPSAIRFADKVKAKALLFDTDQRETENIFQAALIHRVYRQLARSLIRKTRAKCLVVGNANRPFEFALWSEATRRNLKTVLLPYQEVELHPARMFSLCRGNFSLVLTYSEYSAAKMRELNPATPVACAGFPRSLDAAELSRRGGRGAPGRKVLYIAGSTPNEPEAAKILRGAFSSGGNLELHVRPHPAANNAQFRGLFDWLDPKNMSDPAKATLAQDLIASDVIVTIGSTVTFDAMTAGIPVVWLTPPSMRQDLANHSIRSQKLALLDASSDTELRKLVSGLLDDRSRYEQVASDQLARIETAGLNKDYFAIVKSSISELVQAA